MEQGFYPHREEMEQDELSEDTPITSGQQGLPATDAGQSPTHTHLMPQQKDLDLSPVGSQALKAGGTAEGH